MILLYWKLSHFQNTKISIMLLKSFEPPLCEELGWGDSFLWIYFKNLIQQLPGAFGDVLVLRVFALLDDPIQLGFVCGSKG